MSRTSPQRLRLRTPVQGLAYVALLGVVVLVPHAIAYAVIPEYVYGAIADAFPACATEDSANCVWNAATMGDGTGNSFIDVNGTAYYFGKGE